MIRTAITRICAFLFTTPRPSLVRAADALQQAQLDHDAAAEARALRDYEDFLSRTAGASCCCDDSLIGLELSDRTVFGPEFTRANR